MKALTLDLMFFIWPFVAASMVYWDIYPQYHEFCIHWLWLGSAAGIADVIRKMVVHRREKNRHKDIQK